MVTSLSLMLAVPEIQKDRLARLDRHGEPLRVKDDGRS